MMTWPDFKEKKVIIVFPQMGDKLSFKNDNFIVADKEGHIKLQVSCYRIFAIYVVGGFSITTGLIERSKRFGFSIVFFTSSFKKYEAISFELQGNTILRQKQYYCDKSDEIARSIILNKIENQKNALKQLRNSENKNAIDILEKCTIKLCEKNIDSHTIMGIEGVAAKAYFQRIFYEFNWHGRQPRVKRDQINLLLDIGYTILFNYIEGLFNLYGFDIYKGNLHKDFYMRKSLVCDIIEPFRPIIDYKIRKCYKLGSFNKYEFYETNGQYGLNWEYNADFMLTIISEINSYKKCIFDYIQSYYRWIMKNKDIEDFPKVRLMRDDIN